MARPPQPHRCYEIRCPVHGFIQLNDWELGIVTEPVFQRLRRIRQLAWTDQVYPGAMHTRFEHSLGVMHTATLLYDAIVRNSAAVLKSELAYDDGGLFRHRQLVRLAALVHDVGHAPFSHAAEDLFPCREGANAKYRHEHYSAAIVRAHLRSAIEDHPANNNCGFKADDVAALLEGSAGAKQGIFWRDLIDGQMDADRMDYLLRDSHHSGVQYGRFDIRRLISTVQAIPGAGSRPPRLGISEGGWHAAEALVLARYFMFTQMYFHKTRVAYDVHLRGALRELLPGGLFPPPVGARLKEFLSWDDWKVLGLLAEGQGGEHGSRLSARNHFRLVYATHEICTEEEAEAVARVKQELGDLLVAEEPASKSWYKTGKTDIPVVSDTRENVIAPLSHHSSVIASIKGNNQVLLYARPERVAEARKAVGEHCTMNDLTERIGLIASLAEKRPNLGRTALMKYCYFLQTLRHVPLGYSFSLYSYGPFDSGLLADLDAAEATGGVKSIVEYYQGGYSYRIEPGEKAGISKRRAAEFLRRFECDIDWVLDEFKDLKASDLELASTILYCDREASLKREQLTEEELTCRVHDVKPHFTVQQVRSSAEGLRNRGLLESVAAAETAAGA